MTQFTCKGVKQINKCRGKLLISIKRAMNSSRIELLWLVWDQSRSKYYLRTKFQDGIDKPQKCRNVCYHPTLHQQSDRLKNDVVIENQRIIQTERPLTTRILLRLDFGLRPLRTKIG
jgi:hypothetical protein